MCKPPRMTVKSDFQTKPELHHFEFMEGRTLLSVATNAAGWTVITPSSTDHVIYCSSSLGNDNNSGLRTTTPVKTISRAESLIRNGTGDELLLKAGDVWHTSIVFWKWSGKSAQDPMVLGSYGTGPRPEIMSGALSGFSTGDSSAPEVDFLSIMGIHFLADARDPLLTKTPSTKDPVGIAFLTKSNGILVENCECEYYDVNMNYQDLLGPVQNVTVRRNIILNSWASDTHAEGLYAIGVTNLTLDGNFFDHNGWNSTITGAGQTIFNHDAYLSAYNFNCVVKNNVFAEASAYGLQDRPGGIVQNNVFINDPTAMSYGIVNGAQTTVGGVTGDVSNNVFIGGGSIGKSTAGGAMEVGNVKPGSGAVISNNIFTQAVTGASAAILVERGGFQSNPQDSVGVNDLKVSSNVFYNWTLGFDASAGQVAGGTGLTAFNRVSITNNKFENLTGAPVENHTTNYATQETITGNSYYNTRGFLIANKYGPVIGTVLTTPMAFVDPTRSIASYDATTFGTSGSVADLLSRAAQMSEVTWDPRLAGNAIAAYIQQGYATTVVNPARSAKSTFQALNYDAEFGGLKFDNYKGLGYISGGDWAEYKQIDFGTGVTNFTALIATGSGHGSGTIQLRLDSPTGALVGTITPTNTGDWSIYTSQSTSVSGATGVHDLYLVFTGGQYIANIETFQFS